MRRLEWVHGGKQGVALRCNARCLGSIASFLHLPTSLTSLSDPTPHPTHSPACSHPTVVKVATQLDRATVLLDAQPLARAGLVFYLLVLHLVAMV